MKLTYHDIESARMWAETNCGDDNPVDVYAYKLLDLVAQSHESNAAYHVREAEATRKLMAEIESRFVIAGPMDEF